MNEQQQMQQQELPFATIRGEVLVEKPQDLFIPSGALEISLSAFEGPLDLLLYLIRKQKFDVADLPIAPITEQYLLYIDVMQDQTLELASEYLVMAAHLAEIKSKLLLPKQIVEDEEVDPRAELIRRLQEYEMIKQAAELLNNLPQEGRDIHVAKVDFADNFNYPSQECDVELSAIVNAFQNIMKRQAAFEHHHIEREALSTQDRMQNILRDLNDGDASLTFNDCFTKEEGKAGVVVTFIAILELLKAQLIACVFDVDEQHFTLKRI